MKINGHLLFEGAGQVKNLVIEVLSADPTGGNIVGTGHTYYNSVSKQLRSYNGTAWDNVTGVDTLDELTDVTITSVATGDMLVFTGSQWVNQSPSQVRTNLALRPGIEVQAYDAGLLALAAKSSTGIVVQTGADTYTSVTVTAPAAGITITNGDGVAGNPTLVLADDLAALEGLSSAGIAVRTAANTWALTSVVGTAGRVTVADGDGVSANPTIDLATVTIGSGGSFNKTTFDLYGRVSQTTLVVTADITALVDDTYVNVAGDTMSSAANLVFSGGGKVTGLPTPTADTDAASKAYVDSSLTGLSWKNAVKVATTADIDLGNDLVDSDVIDGVVLATGDRVLVKNQSTASQNGIYLAVASGAAVRASDMNAAAEFDGAAVFVQEGTVNANNGYTQTATVATVGTDAVTFSQFSGSSTYTWGVGLNLSGNTVNVNLGAGIVELPSDEVGLDIVSGKAVQLTSSLTGGQLTFLIDGSTLTQSGTGLKIASAGVTAVELAASVAGDGLAGGAGTALSVNVDASTIEINSGILRVKDLGITTAKLADSSVTNVKLANNSVDTSKILNGSVTDVKLFNDAVTTAKILNANVTNAKLANSSITFAGDATSDAVSLGETLTVAGGTGIDTSITTNTLTVTLNASLDELNNVSGCDGAATGSVVAKGSAGIVARKIYHFADSSTPAITHTITHSLGQQFVTVCVYDSSNEMIIPQSITLTSSSVVTVTFNSAIACKVVVMGMDTTS